MTLHGLPEAPFYPAKPELQSGIEVIRQLDLASVALRKELLSAAPAVIKTSDRYFTWLGIESLWTVFAPNPPNSVVYHAIVAIDADETYQVMWAWQPGQPAPATWFECQFILNLAARGGQAEQAMALQYYARRFKEMKGHLPVRMAFWESVAVVPLNRPLEQSLETHPLLYTSIEPSR